jgi:3,4-dihydroxy 2-butanone 4-phosphate synthase/GTP cyclohydrolase II
VHAFSPLRDLLDAKYDSAPSWSSHAVLSFLAKQPSGVMVWVNHDNTIDFAEALHAFNNREGKTTTHEYRSIGVGAQILRYLGVRQMRLMSSPMRFNALSGFDIEVLEYLPAVNPH